MQRKEAKRDILPKNQMFDAMWNINLAQIQK